MVSLINQILFNWYIFIW